jgi:hypothetical protein
MPEPDIVSSSEVLRIGGAGKEVTGGTFLQKTGLLLATAVGTLASIVTVSLVIGWVWSAPRAPAIPVGMDPAQARILIENYKLLQQAALEPFLSLFDSIVVKVLLPVFTGILGYIFGSRGNESRG